MVDGIGLKVVGPRNLSSDRATTSTRSTAGSSSASLCIRTPLALVVAARTTRSTTTTATLVLTARNVRSGTGLEFTVFELKLFAVDNVRAGIFRGLKSFRSLEVYKGTAL